MEDTAGYIVIKASDVYEHLPTREKEELERLLTMVSEGRAKAGYFPLTGIVLESGTDEYYSAFKTHGQIGRSYL